MVILCSVSVVRMFLNLITVSYFLTMHMVAVPFHSHSIHEPCLKNVHNAWNVAYTGLQKSVTQICTI